MSAVYWLLAADSLPVRAAAPEPPPARVDVAVLGAGFAGLSIALDLLRTAPGLWVALIEANQVGHGASGRNAGLVFPVAVLPWLLPGSAGGHDPYRSQRLMHARVTTHARQLSQEYPDAEVRAARLVLLASNRLTAAGLAWVGDVLDRTGIAAEHWPAEQVTAACGAPARAALVLDAWTIQPALLAAQLAARFVAAGGTLHERTRVSAVVPTRTGVTVHAGDATVQADHVVVCTGAYTGALAVPDPLRARPVHSYMRASLGLPESTTATLGGDGLFVSAPGLGMPYWRVHGRRLLFGGLDISGLTPGSAADGLRSAHRRVDRLLRRRLPGAAGLLAAYRWGGAMHVTPSEAPYLAHSATSDRVVYAVGFGGSGVALTLNSGPLVRDLVLGPTTADPEAVALRQAIQSTSIPWRSLATTVRPGVTHLLRGLVQ
jgi:gamma-glutamylputrescine oxidase